MALELNRLVHMKSGEQRWHAVCVSAVTVILQGSAAVGGWEPALRDSEAPVVAFEFCVLLGPETEPCQPTRAKSIFVE